MKVTGLLIALILFLSIHNPTLAARSITITADKTSLVGDEILTIFASPSGFATDEAIFIKGAFYQENSSPNYFGYTQKNDLWIKNSQTSTDQPQIKIYDWNNILKIKADFLDSGYKGEGDYKVKLGYYYYTSSGNLSSVNWSSNSLTTTINEPDPTPTPSPSPTPTPTPSPTPTSTPTQTPTPTPTRTPTPTTTPTSKPTLSKTPTPSEASPSVASAKGGTLSPDTTQDVLGASTSAQNKNSGLLPLFFTIIGVIASIFILILRFSKSRVE